MKRGQRREEILQTLAKLLEDRTGAPITTARLAKEVGVSEAALYRHFPSKAKIYDALVDYIEESIFPRITMIISNESNGVDRCGRIAELILAFSSANPGLTRILSGHALVGENERLISRVNQILGRMELQFKQIIREAEAQEGLRTRDTLGVSVGLLTAFIDGKLIRYVRSHFAHKPDAEWRVEWPILQQAMFQLGD